MNTMLLVHVNAKLAREEEESNNFFALVIGEVRYRVFSSDGHGTANHGQPDCTAT